VFTSVALVAAKFRRGDASRLLGRGDAEKSRPSATAGSRSARARLGESRSVFAIFGNQVCSLAGSNLIAERSNPDW